MGHIQVFINQGGIDRTTILSQTSDEEVEMLEFYSVIAEDLRSLHEKIVSCTKAEAEGGEVES